MSVGRSQIEDCKGVGLGIGVEAGLGVGANEGLGDDGEVGLKSRC